MLVGFNLETIAQKQGPIDIKDCSSQHGRHTQQSTGVTLVVTEEMYWPMPIAILHGTNSPGYDSA